MDKKERERLERKKIRDQLNNQIDSILDPYGYQQKKHNEYLLEKKKEREKLKEQEKERQLQIEESQRRQKEELDSMYAKARSIYLNRLYEQSISTSSTSGGAGGGSIIHTVLKDSDSSDLLIGNVSLENTVALQGYAPKMNYYLGASPSNGIITLGNSQILFNPGFPIQIYKTQSVQSTVAHTTILSAGNLLIGLYKYDYPNEKFTLAAEWKGPIASGTPKYDLSSPVDLTPGTYFTGYIISSGSARGTYGLNTQMNVTHVDPNQNYENTLSLINRMLYNVPSPPIAALPAEILQSDMVFSSSSTPILPPTIIFE